MTKAAADETSLTWYMDVYVCCESLDETGAAYQEPLVRVPFLLERQSVSDVQQHDCTANTSGNEGRQRRIAERATICNELLIALHS